MYERCFGLPSVTAPEPFEFAIERDLIVGRVLVKDFVGLWSRTKPPAQTIILNTTAAATSSAQVWFGTRDLKYAKPLNAMVFLLATFHFNFEQISALN